MPQLEPIGAIAPIETDRRTATEKNAIALSVALIPILTEWARVFAGKERTIDVGLVKSYANSLAKLVRTPAELAEVKDEMLLEKTYFPTPAEIADWVKVRRTSKGYAGWVSALDSRNGGTILCRPENALDGYYVPEGGGNGRGCAPMADLADIRRDLRDKRKILGVKRLADATPAQMEEAGVPLRHALNAPGPQALPVRTPYMDRQEVSPDVAERLISEARETAEANRGGQR